MKSIIKASVFFSVLIIAGAAIAQDEKPTEPMMAVIIQEKIDFAHYSDYIEGTKKWIDVIKAEGLPLYFWAFSDEQGHMQYVMPISSMAEIDDKAKIWSQAVAKLRESAWGQKRQAAVKYSRYTIWMRASQISYVPENFDMTDESFRYMKWIDVQVSHSNEAAFHKAMAEIREFYASQGVDRPFLVYRNLVGEKGPLYTISFPAKDPADYFNYSNKLQQKLGEEMARLRQQVWDLSSDITLGAGWTMPEMSLMHEMQ